ncbi:MAG: N-6 DNA methylase [Phycisphaerae bacterium]|nr:N-6 DNA methylase [Phycisphaerae bacterium]
MDGAILKSMERWRDDLAGALRGRESHPDENNFPTLVQRTVERFLFQRMCEARCLEPSELMGPELRSEGRLSDVVRELAGAEPAHAFSRLPPEALGRAYEHFLDRPLRSDGRGNPGPGKGARKAGGVYYTPQQIVDHVVRHTIGPLWPSPALRILDPACGGGFFLLAAYRALLDAYSDHRQLAVPDRIELLRRHIHGVDIDAQAVEVTRRSLLLEALGGDAAAPPSAMLQREARAILARNICCGNAIVGPDFREESSAADAIDWPAAFPDAFQHDPPGFDAVVGNPPWGQKDIVKDGAIWAYLRRRYRSLAGIADVFRPFVERAVTLVRPGGAWGMVLPDIVLLKDYVETRRFLLDELSLTHADWWGMAFSSASIDVATLIGRRVPAPTGHAVQVSLRDRGTVTEHVLQQDDFRRNERLAFNLHLTPERRDILDHLACFPTLGQVCEIHEGVHSGNIRSELFVDRPVDASCRPLLFGRDEISPYELRWNGKHIRLSVLPVSRTRDRYANAGRPQWHDREKVLLRRTGDFVLAAVDRERRYASNNFFVVFSRVPSALTLDGLTALLNSPLITWFFRCIEPRQGRAFAELKIKHLRRFPVPFGTVDPALVQSLNGLGAYRAELAGRLRLAHEEEERQAITRVMRETDRQIAGAVFAIFGLTARWKPETLRETSPTGSRREVARSPG